MKILFVDDNELNRIVMHDMLEVLFESVHLKICSCAQEVLELEDIDSYDFILSDIDMPYMDGFELFRKLREELNYKKPIIAVTALAVNGDRERMLMHGFDDYISKPINMSTLHERLQKYSEELL